MLLNDAAEVHLKLKLIFCYIYTSLRVLRNLTGTDATHAEHIETIKQRLYVGLQNEIYFVPGCLGMGLVEGYDSMGFPMSKPNLRSDLEADLKHICDGRKDPKQVLSTQLTTYKEVFRIALEQVISIKYEIFFIGVVIYIFHISVCL